MPHVTKPSDEARQKKSDKVFTWDMDGVFYVTSKVTVGVPDPLLDNYYQGTSKNSPTNIDGGVNHPGGAKRCTTRVKYQKQNGGAWYGDGSVISQFYSDNG
jgi:hypothetical protein